MRTTTVQCPECGEQHETNEVEFINIEENMQGWDVLYYVCPVTHKETNSVVRG